MTRHALRDRNAGGGDASTTSGSGNGGCTTAGVHVGGACHAGSSHPTGRTTASRFSSGTWYHRLLFTASPLGE